jgi:hypothetical protein
MRMSPGAVQSTASTYSSSQGANTPSGPSGGGQVQAGQNAAGGAQARARQAGLDGTVVGTNAPPQGLINTPQAPGPSDALSQPKGDGKVSPRGGTSPTFSQGDASKIGRAIEGQDARVGASGVRAATGMAKSHSDLDYRVSKPDATGNQSHEMVRTYGGEGGKEYSVYKGQMPHDTGNRAADAKAWRGELGRMGNAIRSEFHKFPSTGAEPNPTNGQIRNDAIQDIGGRQPYSPVFNYMKGIT